MVFNRTVSLFIYFILFFFNSFNRLPPNYSAPQLPMQPIFSHVPLPQVNSTTVRPTMEPVLSPIRSRPSYRSYGLPTLSSVFHSIPTDVLNETKDPIKRQAGLAALMAMHHDVTYLQHLPSRRVERHAQCMERIPSPHPLPQLPSSATLQPSSL